MRILRMAQVSEVAMSMAEREVEMAEQREARLRARRARDAQIAERLWERVRAEFEPARAQKGGR